MIVVAKDISPADMMQFRNAVFSGFVTDEGGRNSHTAIVSSSLGIPAVVGLGNASHLIEQDDWLIIDSDAGVVIVAPSAEVISQYRMKLAVLLKARKKLTKLEKNTSCNPRRYQQLPCLPTLNCHKIPSARWKLVQVA